MTNPRWQYGDAGDRYPLEPGAVYSVGDRVILGCGDLEQGAGERLLEASGWTPTLVVTDPPWNTGNVNSFRTKAGLADRTQFGVFIRRLIRLIATVDEVWMEMGKQSQALVTELLLAQGYTVTSYPSTYYDRHPCLFLHAIRPFRPVVRFDHGIPELDETPLTGWIMDHICDPQEQTVFDPCTGRGLMALEAARVGARFLGLELNPRRLAVTVDRLVQAGLGSAPVRIA